jgi:peptidyl-dipeptidase Dcp
MGWHRAKAGLDRGRLQGRMRVLDPAARICADPRMTDRNPLLVQWTTPFGVPPFAEIQPGHFVPAFAAAMAEHLAEIAAIGADPAAPTFANTVEALQRSGRALTRVSGLFFNLVVSQGGAALEALDRELSPTLAQHGMRVALDAGVFRRVATLHAQQDTLGLEETRRACWSARIWASSAVALPCRPAQQARMTAISERLATPAHRLRPERPA